MPSHTALRARGTATLYAAKLLFQWRVVENGKAKRRRLCEDRVILLRARSPREALTRARRYGARESFEDPRGRRGRREVFFEFVGVVDLDAICADLADLPAEVWYELRERLDPMERRRALLVPESQMRAVHVPSRRRGRAVV